MRLIDTWTFRLEEFDEDAIPEYAILSHTWEDEEVIFADMKHLGSARDRKGFTKIARAAELAIDKGLRWVWIDTCCIDKSSSAELQEAINSMWRWYSNATVCYVFISDLPRKMPYLTDDGAFRKPDKKYSLSLDKADHDAMYAQFTRSRWFTRGWCLQELIAPRALLFYTLRPNGGKCKLIGDRSHLLRTISEATKIDAAILDHKAPLSSRSVAQRMSWAAYRQTRRVEDQAYSLLGIFDVSMPMLYGEGKRAFVRLQEEIMRTNSDHSLFAWNRDETSDGALLASGPSDFAGASNIVQWGQPQSFEMTNRGLRIRLPLLPQRTAQFSGDVAILNCRYTDSFLRTIALRLQTAGMDRYHVAVSTTPSSKVGPIPVRLTVVEAQDAKLAAKQDIFIARAYEPQSSRVRFMLNLDLTSADRSHDYVCDVYTEQESFNAGAPVFGTTKGPVARQGVMLRYPSGRQISLVFGFDRFPRNEDNGVLLPGIWARFHRGPQRLKDIVKVAPIHAHGRGSTCRDPMKDGCPFMPKTASVSLRPEGDVLEASIKHQLLFDEDVFIINAEIKQEHELDAVHSGLAPEDTVRKTEVMSASRAIMPMLRNAWTANAAKNMIDTVEGSLNTFVPDVRNSVFTDDRWDNPPIEAPPLMKPPSPRAQRHTLTSLAEDTGRRQSSSRMEAVLRPRKSSAPASSAWRTVSAPFIPEVQALPAFRDLHIPVEAMNSRSQRSGEASKPLPYTDQHQHQQHHEDPSSEGAQLDGKVQLKEPAGWFTDDLDRHLLQEDSGPFNAFVQLTSEDLPGFAQPEYLDHVLPDQTDCSTTPRAHADRQEHGSLPAKHDPSSSQEGPDTFATDIQAGAVGVHGMERFCLEQY